MQGKKSLPATHGKGENNHPFPLRREFELEHQRDWQDENDKIGDDVAYAGNENEGAVVDTRPAGDGQIPAIGNWGALEDGDKGTSNGPTSHEDCDGNEAIVESSLRENGVVHAQDAEFDKGHADAIEVFVDDVDLSSGDVRLQLERWEVVFLLLNEWFLSLRGRLA